MSKLFQAMMFGEPPVPLTASRAGSPAKTSALPAAAKGLPESEAACGPNSSASFATYDPDSSSWRTSPLSGLEDWSRSLEILPPSGSMLNGQLFRRAPWVRHTCDGDCSLWPTPTASMARRGFGLATHLRSGRYRLSTVLRVRGLTQKHGWKIHPNFIEALMRLPVAWTEIEPSATPLTRT